MTRAITLVPHTHWDREWYLPFEAFRERLVGVLDELLDLLDADFPHFHLDGQTAMIDDYLAVRPERERDFERHARAGRISVGPWLTLVDEFLVSGETIVRSLELGLARTRELGGGDLVGYLPDQFGHVGQMPQILASAGIDRAVVWRGVPLSIERSQFWWEAPDGSRVLVEYLPFGYSLGGDLHEAAEPADLAARLDELAGLLAPFSARERVLVPAGMDHASVEGTLPDRLAAMRRQGLGPEAEIGSLASYLDSPVDGELPVLRGELRSAARAHLLPGVYSTRIHQKQERARIEALVERYAEPLAALVPGFEWPGAELDRIWRLLVLNGAHDSVCGCSIDEVAHAVDARHAEARAAADAIVEGALGALAEQVRDAGTLRFNPSPFERDGVPGLGWRVEGMHEEPPPAPVELELRDGWIVADGVELGFTDEKDVGDLYNFCPAKRGSAAAPLRLEVEGGEAVARFRRRLEVRLGVERRPGEPFLRLRLVLDNKRADRRLRLHVRLPAAVDEVVAASAFELVRRPLVSEGGELETPSPTWPARGAVLAGGVAVLAEGVVEYEVVSRRTLAVTLLRCVGTISRSRLATRPHPAGPDIATPEAQMIGRTELALGVLRGAEAADLVEAWERFALPLRSVPATGGGALPPAGSLLEVEGAALSSVRAEPDRLDVRVWNPSTEPVQARVAGEPVALGPAAIATIPVRARDRRG